MLHMLDSLNIPIPTLQTNPNLSTFISFSSQHHQPQPLNLIIFHRIRRNLQFLIFLVLIIISISV